MSNPGKIQTFVRSNQVSRKLAIVPMVRVFFGAHGGGISVWLVTNRADFPMGEVPMHGRDSRHGAWRMVPRRPMGGADASSENDAWKRGERLWDGFGAEGGQMPHGGFSASHNRLGTFCA